MASQESRGRSCLDWRCRPACTFSRDMIRDPDNFNFNQNWAQWNCCQLRWNYIWVCSQWAIHIPRHNDDNIASLDVPSQISQSEVCAGSANLLRIRYSIYFDLSFVQQACQCCKQSIRDILSCTPSATHTDMRCYQGPAGASIFHWWSRSSSTLRLLYLARPPTPSSIHIFLSRLHYQSPDGVRRTATALFTTWRWDGPLG